MKQAIGYIRVSTDKQADEGVSLDAQKAKIGAWCLANGYELVAVQVDAISGKSMDKRQGLLKALASLDRGMALVVYSLSRLARSTKDAISIGDTISKKKCDLVSLTEKLDTTTAAGKMMFQMLAVLAEFERNLVGERTKMALAHKKAKGEKYGTVPFGYSEVEGNLVRVESEALVVANIIKQRKAGTTLQAIAEGLNSKGIAGKQGGKWYPSTVRYLIQRQAA